MADDTPSALIVHFVPRRKQPRVCIAIHCHFLIDTPPEAMPQPANSDEASAIGGGTS